VLGNSVNVTKIELRLLVAVYHPWNSKLIDEHSEACSPERLLDGHLDVGAFGQRSKDSIGIFGLIHTD
jgi:hypothetical protein